MDLALGTNYRAIVISDIHGNLNALQDVLRKADYDAGSDILIIVGDMIEKGPRNLETLRFVMDLAQAPNAHVVLGNNDAILLDIAKDECHDEIREYLLWQHNSVLHDMCVEIRFTVSAEMDTFDMYRQLREHFKPELSFVAGLPIAIETEEFIFAHAGIEPRDDYRESDYDYVTHFDRFGEVDYRYSKKVIVGHWPTGLYSGDKMDAGVIIDDEKNIISIDGGNVVNAYGQLNALIIENTDSSKLSFVYSDSLPQAMCTRHQAGTKRQKICYPYNQIEIHAETSEHVIGILKSYSPRGRTPDNLESVIVSVPKNLIFSRDGKQYVHECVNALLELRVGDTVQIVYDNGGEMLICKHAGRVGLVRKDILSSIGK